MHITRARGRFGLRGSKSANRPLARRVTVTVLAAVAVACSVLGFTAAAADASTFVTPYYGMTCSTWTGKDQSTNNYYGAAQCTGDGKWRVSTSCSWGLTYKSLIWIQYQSEGPLTLTAGNCYWGVQSFSVEEFKPGNP
jgi:hypothetical protein